MENRYDRESSRQQDEEREAFRREYGRRDRGQSSRGGNEQYFGGSMHYGEGYTGGGRDYDSSRRGYDEGYSQPGFGRGGNFGSEYDSGAFRRRGGYSGFGSEASQRHSGVGYSGQSDYRGEDWSNRYGSRFSGQGTEDFGNYGRSYPESERGYGGNYGGRERGWWDRTSDEVASWFGDEEAARRRSMDSRHEGQYRGRGPSSYKRSDERIKEDINDRMTDHPYLDASNINVETQGGEVMISGTVESRQQKRLAEDIAENVSGVRNVENRIRVNDTYSTAEIRSPNINMSDESSTPSSKAASRG